MPEKNMVHSIWGCELALNTITTSEYLSFNLGYSKFEFYFSPSTKPFLTAVIQTKNVNISLYPYHNTSPFQIKVMQRLQNQATKKIKTEIPPKNSCIFSKRASAGRVLHFMLTRDYHLGIPSATKSQAVKRSTAFNVTEHPVKMR
ncbi:hypothetical protein TNCT_695911 [Trichonephila clavata]|uniref:Uncharacterized protein n=1 Tax=Trichonephila clavata TaxID=2740835 RepID=A0A8X6L0H2_TRICU|nr:hypothetical protein TNCT_695911 [Trichonephila clavata]